MSENASSIISHGRFTVKVLDRRLHPPHTHTHQAAIHFQNEYSFAMYDITAAELGSNLGSEGSSEDSHTGFELWQAPFHHCAENSCLLIYCTEHVSSRSDTTGLTATGRCWRSAIELRRNKRDETSWNFLVLTQEHHVCQLFIFTAPS